MWINFKIFIKFITILFLFCVLFVCLFVFACKACRILTLQPGIILALIALNGKVLTTGPTTREILVILTQNELNVFYVNSVLWFQYFL